MHRKNRRRAVSYASTVLARLPRDTSGTRNYRRSAVVERCCVEKTAEERFHTLARGWLAYPVTPVEHATTAEERL